MTTPQIAAAPLQAPLNRLGAILGTAVPDWLLLLIARLAIASVFFLSGRTKVEGLLTITPSTYALFADEYRVPLLSPEAAAHLATYAEHALPVLLAVGLLTRLSALALFGMTLVIQFIVGQTPQGIENRIANPDHYFWMLLFGVIILHGPGRISLDWLLMRWLGRA